MSHLYDNFDFPEEFLRDPSYWMEAHRMEQFLNIASEIYLDSGRDGHPLIKAGHICQQARVWGVLDSVLRMMTNPLDIFNQPTRFLSYFISPEPRVSGLHQTSGQVAFSVSLSSHQFPMSTEFLRSAFEALPAFVGQPMADATWEGDQFHLKWESKQKSLLDESESQRQLSPELFHSVLVSLQQSQKELSASRNDLAALKKQIGHSAQGMGDVPEMPTVSLREELRSEVQSIREEVHRMVDYFARARQLVTLMKSEAAGSVDSIMHRMDWERSQSQFGDVANEAIRHSQKLLSRVDMFAQLDSETDFTRDWFDADKFIQSQLAFFQHALSPSIQLYLDEVSASRIFVDCERFQLAVEAFFDLLSQSTRGATELRLRIAQTDAKIELVADAKDFELKPKYRSNLYLQFLTKVAEMHGGQVICSNEGEDFRIALDLPQSST